tara:strand:+ start:622 stop:954 length:333 start_codon:yes stop_codon:yes gene_type:complete
VSTGVANGITPEINARAIMTIPRERALSTTGSRWSIPEGGSACANSMIPFVSLVASLIGMTVNSENRTNVQRHSEVTGVYLGPAPGRAIPWCVLCRTTGGNGLPFGSGVR